MGKTRRKNVFACIAGKMPAVSPVDVTQAPSPCHSAPLAPTMGSLLSNLIIANVNVSIN